MIPDYSCHSVQLLQAMKPVLSSKGASLFKQGTGFIQARKKVLVAADGPMFFTFSSPMTNFLRRFLGNLGKSS